MTVKSEPLSRAAAIAELVATEPNGMTVAQIADAMALSRSTALRVVRRLVEIGFLDGEGRHTAYTIGPRLQRIARLVSGEGAFSSSAEAVLQELADQLGVTTYIAGYFDYQVSPLIVKSPEGSPFSIVPGKNFAIHASAGSKVVLAYQSESVIDYTLSKGLEKFTENTIVDTDVFAAQLHQIRKDGYAVSSGEIDPSLWGIACPILDRFTDVTYSVGIITIKQTIEDEPNYIKELLPYLERAAEELRL